MACRPVSDIRCTGGGGGGGAGGYKGISFIPSCRQETSTGCYLSLILLLLLLLLFGPLIGASSFDIIIKQVLVRSLPVKTSSERHAEEE